LRARPASGVAAGQGGHPELAMAAEGEAPEQEEPQQQEFGGTEAGWDDPGGEPGDLSSLSAQTEWLNQQQPMVSAPRGRSGLGW